jgi:hypothetical protein
MADVWNFGPEKAWFCRIKVDGRPPKDQNDDASHDEEQRHVVHELHNGVNQELHCSDNVQELEKDNLNIFEVSYGRSGRSKEGATHKLYFFRQSLPNIEEPMSGVYRRVTQSVEILILSWSFRPTCGEVSFPKGFYKASIKTRCAVWKGFYCAQLLPLLHL